MPSDDDGEGDHATPGDDGETGQAACEAAGGTWEQCPPNADCTFWCKFPEPGDDGEPDGDDTADGDDATDGDELPDDDAGPSCVEHGTRESCDAAGCTWGPCAPGADCKNQCWGEAECEGAGGTWRECPPFADCVYPFWCTFGEPDPKPGSFACGPDEQCSAGEFCEVVASDVPEFPTGYNRYQCRSIPGGSPACDADYCACIEDNATCAVFDIEVSGTCAEPTPGAYTLTCGVGG
jgi:hypothetical protein